MAPLTPEQEAKILEAIKKALDDPAGTPTHDVSGDAFKEGVTTFSPKVFLDAAAKMEGDCRGVVVSLAVLRKMLGLHGIEIPPNTLVGIHGMEMLGGQVFVGSPDTQDPGTYDSWLFDGGTDTIKLVRLVTREHCAKPFEFFFRAAGEEQQAYDAALMRARKKAAIRLVDDR